jgi:hypothetical protein
MDAALMLFERDAAQLAGSVGRRARAQEARQPLQHHRCGGFTKSGWSVTAWLPRPCRKNYMNGSTMSYGRAGGGSGRGISGHENAPATQEHQGLRSNQAPFVRYQRRAAAVS